MNDFKLFKALNYNAGLTILNIIFGFFINILLVNQLGLKFFGELSIVIVFSAIIYSFSVFGLGSTMVHKFVHYNLNNFNIKYLIYFIYGFVQFMALIFVLFLFKSGIILHFEIKNNLLVVFAVFIQTLIGFPITIMTSYLESIQNLKGVFIANIASNIFKLLGLLCISLFNKKILAALFLIYLIPNIINLIFLTLNFKKNYIKPKQIANIADSIKEFFHTIKFSFKLLPVILAELTLSNFIIVIYAGKNNEETVAVIRILLGFFTMILSIPAIIGRTMLPFYSKLAIRKKLNILKLFNSIILKVSFLFFCIISILLVLFSKEILAVYNINYLLYLNWFYVIIYMIISMFSSYQGCILIALNKPHYVSGILFLGSLIHVVIGFILYSYWSFFGLLVSLGLAYFIMQFTLNIILKSLVSWQFNYKFLIILFVTIIFHYININGLSDMFILSKLLFFMVYSLLLIFHVSRFRFFNTREIANVKKIAFIFYRK